MFSIDSKFFRGLAKIGDFFILGFLGIVFSLPIITMGGAVTAMFSVAMKIAKDEEGYVWSGFWRSFKMNWLQGLAIEAIIAVLAAIMVSNINICMQWLDKEGGTVPLLLIYLMIGFLIVLIGVTLYAFPLLAKFSNTVVGTLKNALLLCMKHVGQTIVMIIITVLVVVYTIDLPLIIVLVVPFLLYVDSFIMSRVLAPYVKQSEEAGMAESDVVDSDDADSGVEEDVMDSETSEHAVRFVEEIYKHK